LIIARNGSLTLLGKIYESILEKLEKKKTFMSIKLSFSVLDLAFFCQMSSTCAHTKQFELAHQNVGFLGLAVFLHLSGIHKTMTSLAN